METTFIYGLFDPRYLELRYIGKSSKPDERLREHISFSRGRSGKGYGHNPPKEKWIRELLSENLEPVIEVLEECTNDDWQEVEKSWIKEAREKGARLLNITEGGDGFGPGKSHPMFGRKLTEEHKKKCSISLTGYKHSEETKRKIGRKGKIVSQETRDKISKSHPSMKGEDNNFYGRMHTEKTKRMIGIANAKLTEEQVIAIREQWDSTIYKYGLIASLAEAYSISRATIARIVRNEIWKYLL